MLPSLAPCVPPVSLRSAVAISNVLFERAFHLADAAFRWLSVAGELYFREHLTATALRKSYLALVLAHSRKSSTRWINLVLDRWTHYRDSAW